MPLMYHLNAEAIATTNELENITMCHHKRKDGGSKWSYRYTIHERQREMSLEAMRNISLK
ncbi:MULTISPECIES: DUF4102 domain-containing protein [unclassified Bartonella]|uniref:DUF4102 domain-containing protein n=1 Tax=unclassified Bartonella TaxID=2645622 RepID=UPI0035D00B93